MKYKYKYKKVRFYLSFIEKRMKRRVLAEARRREVKGRGGEYSEKDRRRSKLIMR